MEVIESRRFIIFKKHCLRFKKHGLMQGALAGAIAVGVLFAGTLAAKPIRSSVESNTASRSTLAVTYRDGSGTSVDMIGGAVRPGLLGKADVKRKDGRTRVSLHMEDLPHPQSLGSFYTTYLLWAVAPEGRAESLAELAHSKDFDVEVTTSLQTFGLIVTAEPHSAVGLPGPLVIAENTLRKDTQGRVQVGRVEYRSAPGYLTESREPGPPRDFTTPLLVLGARRAITLARDAGAAEYVDPELREAEIKLGSVEQAWGRKGVLPKDLQAMARDAMRIAEHARTQSIERRQAARLADERRAKEAALARMMSEADRARLEAEQARAESQKESARANQARQETVLAQERVTLARAETERARTDEERARAEAEQARLEAQDARRDRAELQEKLFQSLSAILETRREARGLIVNLSDVLFDFNRASLKPGAREKLSKLSGILLAYPGAYHIEIEGHTDAVGSDEYNMTLSRDRATSVHGYLLQAGVPAPRVGSAQGFGETRPVASNETAAGRQMNRRVEIVIGGLEDNR